MSVEPRSPATVEKRTNTGVRLPASAKMRRARELRERLVALEVAVRGRAARVHDALRNALVVEVRDLLAQDEVLEQRGPAQRRPSASSGCRRSSTPWFVVSARARGSTRTRSSGPLPGLMPACAGLPAFADALGSDSVLAPTAGSIGSTLCPACGSAEALPYSLGFAALNGNASATISVASSFAAARPRPAPERRDGPLTVLRAEVFVWASAPRPPCRLLTGWAAGVPAFGPALYPFWPCALFP